MTVPVEINGLKIGEGMPKVCVPLTGASRMDLYEEAEKVKDEKPDLVEWRADFYEDLFDISEMLETLKQLKKILDDIPLLFTIRTKAEGGNAGISMKDYVDINLAAAKGQADLIDVEVFSEDMTGACEKKREKIVCGTDNESMKENAGNNVCVVKKELIQKLHETRVKVIASSHDFDKTDSKELLLERFQAMDTSGADILKMAMMPGCEEDVSVIMAATDEMRKKFTSRPLVSMSMGNLGVVSRVEGEGFGSSITFAAVGEASAPGQIPINELRERMKAYHKTLEKIY